MRLAAVFGEVELGLGLGMDLGGHSLFVLAQLLISMNYDIEWLFGNLKHGGSFLTKRLAVLFGMHLPENSALRQ
jgi:hypothetical protein